MDDAEQSLQYPGRWAAEAPSRAAIVMAEPDEIIALGAVVADESSGVLGVAMVGAANRGTAPITRQRHRHARELFVPRTGDIIPKLHPDRSTPRVNSHMAAVGVHASIKEDEILLYVSLFQTKGHDTVIWESQLRAIERNIIGRPVYKDLDNVKKIIRLKANPMNEAYAVIKVDKNLIQKPNAFDVERKDRYGNSLETLKPGAVTPDDIIEFFHDNCTYSFSKGHLKLQSGGSDE